MRKKQFRALPLFLLVALLASCTAGTAAPAVTPVFTPAGAATAAATAAATPLPVVTRTPLPPSTPLPPAQFAVYRKLPVTVQPTVSQEPIAGDLSNVASAFLFTAGQQQALAQSGFVVSPSGEKEFYVLYEQARYNYEPIFVSSDSLLHAYHLVFDKLLRTLEVEQFIPALKQFNALMLQDVEDQYEELLGTPLEESARRNVAFIAVGSRLLDPSVPIPPYATDLAEAELTLIKAHSGINPSPLFPALPWGEDYSQYIPRGHYTRSEELKAYFQSLMWYGRMTFLLGTPDKPQVEMTQRALLLTQAMMADKEAQQLWTSIYEPTVFFVGRSDDLLYSEYQTVVAQVYGQNPTLTAFGDESKVLDFIAAAQALRPPKILGIVIGAETEDVDAETKGFRVMGQRFIPDSYMFRQLVWRNVGDQTPPNRRGLPKGLDLLAVMGSQEAYSILEKEGDTNFYSYTVRMDKLQQEFGSLTEADWTQNLYWSWLYTFYPLLEKPGQGYPAFMQSQAWLDKSINTVLGSWTELRHDTILYAKQSYAEMGGGGKGPPPSPTPPKGYVEPVPEFYARLAALAEMTRQGLTDRGLLNATDEDTLNKLDDLALALKTMSEKELTGQPLDESEYERIRYYGGELEHLTFAASDGYGLEGVPYTEEEPQAAVVADVHTDPDPNGDGSAESVVLEEGVGRISAIYAVVPVEGQLVVAKGGVFSYYEFPWPASDRLTDEAWRQMLDEGQVPQLPEWTASFRVEETEDAALRAAVWQFNQQFTSAAWWPDPTYMDAVATGTALETTKAYVQSLVDQGLYEGRSLLQLNYLSFDLQSATQAVVTTHEKWSGERYRSTEEGMEGTLIATRAEYTVGVVYRLEQVNGVWLISQVELQGTEPEWQPVQ